MNKKGWTITELLTAVGIIGVLSSIATLSYMKYYQKGQFSKIHETARNFSAAAQICLLKYEDDDTRKCASFDRLKFKCDYCESKVWFQPDAVNANQFLINLTIAEYRAAVVYRLNETPALPVRIQRTGTSQKFCVSENTTDKEIAHPTRTCDADSDCDTGASEKCHLFPLTNYWGGPSPWKAPPP